MGGPKIISKVLQNLLASYLKGTHHLRAGGGTSERLKKMPPKEDPMIDSRDSVLRSIFSSAKLDETLRHIVGN